MTLVSLSWPWRLEPVGGSWVVISGVISRITISVASITHVRGLTTPLITTNY